MIQCTPSKHSTENARDWNSQSAHNGPQWMEIKVYRNVVSTEKKKFTDQINSHFDIMVDNRSQVKYEVKS